LFGWIGSASARNDDLDLLSGESISASTVRSWSAVGARVVQLTVFRVRFTLISWQPDVRTIAKDDTSSGFVVHDRVAVYYWSPLNEFLPSSDE
jgi:hypothetical protein